MSIYKRKDNNTWRLVISYKKLDGSEGRLCRDFKTKREAIAYDPILRSTAKGVAPNDIVFSAIADDFITSCESTRRYSTFVHYRKITRSHLMPFFKDLKIGSIKRNQVIQWKEQLSREVSKTTGKKYSFCYLSHCWKVLRLIFKRARIIFGVDNNVLEQVGGFHRDPNEVTPERKLHYWTVQQFEKFNKTVNSDIEKFKTAKDSQEISLENTKILLNICFFAGTRRGEANALKVSDFHDGKHPYLSINKSVTEKVGLGRFLETNPKNSSSIRDVPIPSNLAVLLRKHIKDYLSKEYAYTDDFRLAGGPLPISDSTADKIKVKEEEKAGLPHIRIHDLRHSYVSMLIQANVPITVIAKLAGHSSPDITYKIYGHLLPQTKNEAVTAIESLLKAPN
ncbi:MAG: tyrosine-type recombinase/integrase [Bacilli bacterium]